MTSIINADDGSISGRPGLRTISGTSANLQIQVNGATVMNVSSNHSVTFNSTVHMPSIVSPTLETMSLSSNSVSDHANLAFNAANTAVTSGQANVGAGLITTTAAYQANVGAARIESLGRADSAFGQANTAFNTANTKLASAGGTITGNLQIDGNLIITGTTTTVSANNLVVKDNMFYLNDQDYSSNVDLGFAGNYNDGTYRHTGLFRDASDGIWKFYDNYLPEPDAAVNIDTSNTSFRIATVFANVKTDVISVRGMDPLGVANSAFGQANLAYTAANTAVTSGQANVGAGLITTTAAYQANVGSGLITAKSTWEANTGAGLLTRLPLAGGTLTGSFTSSLAPAVINTTTPGLANYGLVFNGASSTDNAQGITWTWANAGGAQAGIYVQSSGSYGTKMYLATTDSFATGARTAVSIDHSGTVNIVRGALQQAGNQVLHAGNYTSYSPTLTGGSASGTWGISITGNAATATNQSGGTVSATTGAFTGTLASNFGLANADNALRIFAPGGASYATSASTVTGAIKIRIPAAALGSNTMLSFKVKVYQYNTSFSNEFQISGYNYGDAAKTWYNVSATALSQSQGAITVRFGFDGTSQCIYIGELASSWSYPQVVVTDFIGGYSGYATSIWASGWSVGFEASAFAGVTTTTTAAATLNSSNYTSYSPTLTGGSASGTWGINITGSSAQLNGLSKVQMWNNSGQNHGTYQTFGAIPDFGEWFMQNPSAADSPATGSQYYVNTVGLGNDYGYGSYALMTAVSRDFTHKYTWYRTREGGGWSAWTKGAAGKADRANGNFYIDDNYGNGVIGVYSSYRYQGVFAMGDAYKLPADGTTTGTLYGMAWSHPNAGGAAGNLTDHGLLIINAGVFKCAISNSIVASGNITAYSDERLKTNWRSMPPNFVARLAQVKVGVYDRLDEENGTQVGVSAQSFQQLLPQAIMTAKDEIGTLSVSYGNAALASAVELAKDNVDLRARIVRLESLIEQILNKE